MIFVFIGLILLVPYLVGWRAFAGHFAWWAVEHWFDNQEKPDGGDWFVAFLLAAFWPLLVPLYVPVWLLGKLFSGICRIYVNTVSDRVLIGAESRARDQGKIEGHSKPEPLIKGRLGSR